MNGKKYLGGTCGALESIRHKNPWSYKQKARKWFKNHTMEIKWREVGSVSQATSQDWSHHHGPVINEEYERQSVLVITAVGSFITQHLASFSFLALNSSNKPPHNALAIKWGWGGNTPSGSWANSQGRKQRHSDRFRESSQKKPKEEVKCSL